MRAQIKNIPLFILVLLFFVGCRSSILDDPSLNIRYSVAQKAHVVLTIENNYNTVIATPVDAIQEAGVYDINLDSSHWLEGIYFYTIEQTGAGNSSYSKTTKKLLLLK